MKKAKEISKLYEEIHKITDDIDKEELVDSLDAIVMSEGIKVFVHDEDSEDCEEYKLCASFVCEDCGEMHLIVAKG